VTHKSIVVAVDVGNTAIKLAVGKRFGVQPHLCTVALDRRDWGEQVGQWVRRSVESYAAEHCADEDCRVEWWISTVNQVASERLAAWAGQEFPASSVKWVTRQDVPLDVQVDAPDRVGIDRLIGAYAASLRFDGSLVVVDAGSAVTVDWMTPGSSGQSVFHGGAILPGIRLQLAALTTGTDGIGKSLAGSERSVESVLDGLETIDGTRPGKNTQHAIRLGVISAICGGIERLSRHYGQLAADSDPAATPRVVLTGGDAAVIASQLAISHQFLPGLVCYGMLDLATAKCQATMGGLE